jgi:hypothetical protein
MRRLLFVAPLLAAILLAGLLGPATAGRAAAPATQTFDITVSLEWNPGRQDAPGASLPETLAAAGCPTDAQATYLDDLRAGLEDASRYLYAYSRGRFALGTVTVDLEGSHWNQADIRILADSSYRPVADVGGIIGTPTRNISATTGVSVTFYPGAATLGRGWNGLGGRCGAWSQPEGWRTIGHEWAHYGLFLWDEYYEQFSIREQYCTTTGFPRVDLRRGERASAATDSGRDSVMAYQYSTDQLWVAGTPESCARTPQMRVNGVSNWETMRRFYPTIGSPDDLPTAPAPAPTFVLSTSASEPTTARIKVEGFPASHDIARAYIVRGAGSAPPTRIIGQGDLVAGEQAALLGARPSRDDRAHIGVEQWNSGSAGARFVYPADSAAAPALDTTPGAPPAVLPITRSTWQPALRIIPLVRQLSPDISELFGLQLRIEDCARRTKTLQVVFCPAGGGCYNQVTLSSVNDGFSTIVGLPDERTTRQAATHGYIYLRSLDTGEEAISTYQVGGGAGSGHIGAHPPLMDGAAVVETPAGQDLPLGQDTRLLASTALVCGAPALPPGVREVVGSPVALEPILADQGGGRTWGTLASDLPLTVRLSYSQDLLDRLGIDERDLVVLRSNKQGAWEIVPTSGRSLDLDWIAAVPAPFDGGGAIYALGRADPRVLLPLVVH